mmetsp:Transcript_3303/g.3795  ORF Transcript_3303/g.3795 Transcript_3303/m.3795 type:complete len:274 (+) Transcript_3303:152-973(+)
MGFVEMADYRVNQGSSELGIPTRSSIVSAIILALCIQQALPVVGLIGLLGVDVHQNFNLTASQETSLTGFKDQEVLLLHNQAGQRSDDGWGHAPINQLTVGHLEGRAVERANDHITNHICSLAHGCANVWAKVAHAEDRTSLRLANQDIVASKSQSFQLCRLQLRSLHSSLDPGKRWQNGLGCVLDCGLGFSIAAACDNSCDAKSSRGCSHTCHTKAGEGCISLSLCATECWCLSTWQHNKGSGLKKAHEQHSSSSSKQKARRHGENVTLGLW